MKVIITIMILKNLILVLIEDRDYIVKKELRKAA